MKITWQSEKKTGLERLQVTINKGAYYHLSKVKLIGNRVMADAVILGKLSVWRKSILWVGAARFEPLEFKKDIEKITRFYRKHGFYDVGHQFRDHL